MVEDTLHKINGFGNDEFLFFQVCLRPVDSDELGVLEACLFEGTVLEDGEAEIAIAEGAILELAMEEGCFAKGAFYEKAGGKCFMLQGIVWQSDAFEFLGGVVGVSEGHRR